MTRAVQLIILIVGFSAATFAQQSTAGPTTLTGCLIGVNGAFTLQATDGQRYILKGEHDKLLSYNGKLIQVTGTRATSKKAAARHEFQVTSVTKIADVCQ